MLGADVRIAQVPSFGIGKLQDLRCIRGERQFPARLFDRPQFHAIFQLRAQQVQINACHIQGFQRQPLAHTEEPHQQVFGAYQLDPTALRFAVRQ